MILKGSLDANIEVLTQRAISLYSKKKDKSQRLIISIAGVPGSGKSTVTEKVCKNLNKILCLQTATILPQDGFHYYRDELMAMKDTQELMKRRGAPFTFNSSRFLQLVKEIKMDHNVTLFAPNFNHDLKDPEENSIKISPLIEIILVEGNYVHLEDETWREIHALSDDKWFVVADFDTIKQRLVQRHIQAGICVTMNESIQRVDANDLLNAKYIIDNSIRPDIILMNQ